MSSIVSENKDECNDGKMKNIIAPQIISKEESTHTLEASSLPSREENENQELTVMEKICKNSVAQSIVNDKLTSHNVSTPHSESLNLIEEPLITTHNNTTASVSDITNTANNKDNSVDDNSIDSASSETNSHIFNSLYSSFSSQVAASPDSLSALSNTEPPYLSSKRSTQMFTEASDGLFLLEKGNIDVKNNANKSRESNTDYVNNKSKERVATSISKPCITTNYKSATTKCPQTKLLSSSSHSPFTIMPLAQFTSPSSEINNIEEQNTLEHKQHVQQSTVTNHKLKVKYHESEEHSSSPLPEESSESSLLLSLLLEQPSLSKQKTVVTAADQSTMRESNCSQKLPLTSSESSTTTPPSSSSAASETSSADQIQLCNAHEMEHTQAPITPSSIACINKIILEQEKKQEEVTQIKQTCKAPSKLIDPHIGEINNKTDAVVDKNVSETICNKDSDDYHHHINEHNNKDVKNISNSNSEFNKHKSTVLTLDSATQQVNWASRKVTHCVPKQPIRKRLFTTSPLMFNVNHVNNTSAINNTDNANLSIKEMFPSFNRKELNFRTSAMSGVNEKETLSKSTANSLQDKQQSMEHKMAEEKTCKATKFRLSLLTSSFFPHLSQTPNKLDNNINTTNNKNKSNRTDKNTNALTSSRKSELNDKNVECRRGGLSCGSSIKSMHTELSNAMQFVYINSHGGSPLLVDECLRCELYNCLLEYYVPSSSLGSVDGLLLFYQVLLLTYKCEEELPWNCFINLLYPEDYILYENYLNVKNWNLLRETKQQNHDFKQTSKVIISKPALNESTAYVTDNKDKLCKKNTIVFDEFVEFIELLSLRHKHN